MEVLHTVFREKGLCVSKITRLKCCPVSHVVPLPLSKVALTVIINKKGDHHVLLL